MDETRIPAAGDPFQAGVRLRELREFEDRCAHERMDADERLEPAENH